MVDDADAVENRVGHKRAQLVFIAAIVRAVGNENRQVRIRHAAALVEIRHQRGDHLILPHPEARHIADDERHAVARRDPRGQRQRVNRRVQRLCQRRGNILDGRHAVPMQLAQHVFFIQRNRNGTVAVSKRIILHLFYASAAFHS